MDEDTDLGVTVVVSVVDVEESVVVDIVEVAVMTDERKKLSTKNPQFPGVVPPTVITVQVLLTKKLLYDTFITV